MRAKSVLETVIGGCNYKEDTMNFWARDINKHPEERRVAIKMALDNLYGIKPFTLVDLCCGIGDSIVYLSDIFPKAMFTGVDTYDYRKDAYGEQKQKCWEEKDNLHFVLYSMQDYINLNLDFDVCTLLNCYRNFPADTASVEGKAHQLKVRDELHAWLHKHVNYFITSLNERRDDAHLPFKYKVIGSDTEPKYPLILCNTKELKNV